MKSFTSALKPILVLLFFITTFSIAAQAQAIIRGKVNDVKSGEPLTGATVTISGTKTLNTPVNLDGSYIFRNVTPGTYTLQVKFVGYKPSQAYSIEVQTGQVLVQNVTLADDYTRLSEVTIKEGTSKETDRSARSLEKNAPSVMNILSANTIQLLPDVTVGNALQRVSGVTIQRSASGEGRYAIIRGMDQRYNNTLVNGIKIPSPDDQFRFVPMDIFPSEMLERLEVIKALTPSMEGDAIGGTMNLIMKSAPSQFVFSANVSGGFSNLFSQGRPFVAFNPSPNKTSPGALNGNAYQATYADFNNYAIVSNTNQANPFNATAGFTIGDRFFNKRLGVIVSASYQNLYRGASSTELTPNAQPESAVGNPNIPLFSDTYNRTYSTQNQRYGVHNKIDIAINSNNKISLYNLYLHTNEYQSRITSDTSGIGINSTPTSKQVVMSNRSTFTQQNVYNSTLQGDHYFDRIMHLNWSAVYSLANRNQPDRTEFSYDSNQSYDTNGNLTGKADNDSKLTHHWESNQDHDVSGYANFIITPKLFDRDAELSIGGLYRHKNRSADYLTYSLKTSIYYQDINSIPFTFSPATDGIASNSPDLLNNYTVKEDDNAEYLQLKFNPLEKLQVLGGVRIENTLQSYATQAPLTVTQNHGSIQYTDVLPSIHLKYELTDHQNLRASYFSSISRPGYGEIIPYKISGEYYDQEGNPDLKHITADNMDLRYELFPGGADQLLLGTFFKKIHNPIEYFVVREGGPSNQVVKPQNDNGDATNYGFEALATKFFGVIGFSINYTYTHSRITTDKLLSYTDPNPTIGKQQTVVSETRPLQGQADNVGNASILFKSGKLGLDMQLAFVYTGERLSQVSTYAGLDFYQHAFNQLDFSFEKTITKKLSFYGKINNLTNTASKIYLKIPWSTVSSHTPREFLDKQDIASQTLVQSDYYKTLFLGGFRYKF
jgi:YD repeat-containing protein